MATAKQIITRCETLRNAWMVRHGKFKDWYNILSLKDELKQEGMESVTSNDPRTGYNLAKHLLTSSIVMHKLASEEFDNQQIVSAAKLEAWVAKQWLDQEKRYRQRGGWLNELVAMALCFGWVNIYAEATADGVKAEIWHPDEVFQDFGVDGTVEVAHIYQLSPAAANRKIKLMGWSAKPVKALTTLYDHWAFDNDGDIANTIVLGTEFVKPPTKEPELSNVGVIPIFSIPVGGLPDRGVISGNDWQKHCGESLVATNEDLAANYNRMRTFYQQATRAAAQSHMFEQTTGDGQVVKQEDANKWGSIFRGGINDRITYLSPPPLPAELTNALYTYQNELQRGLFPWSVFGNIQQTMSYLAMANVASASLQVLTPFLEAIRAALSDVDNFWYKMAKLNKIKPNKLEIPSGIPDDAEFNVTMDVEIPGYMVQRATVARMLDPHFRLDTTTVMNKLFPEIRNPIREQAKVRRTDAMMHPKAVLVDQILAYREQANVSREVKDVETADLYDKLAASLEAELGVPTQPKQQPQQMQASPQEVMPKEISELGVTE